MRKKHMQFLHVTPLICSIQVLFYSFVKLIFASVIFVNIVVWIFKFSPDKHTKCRFQTLIICKCLKSVWSINTYWPFEFDLDRLHYFLLLDYHWLHQYIEHILRLYIYAVPYNSNSVFSCFLPLAVTHYYQTEPCSCISNK